GWRRYGAASNRRTLNCQCFTLLVMLRSQFRVHSLGTRRVVGLWSRTTDRRAGLDRRLRPVFCFYAARTALRRALRSRRRRALTRPFCGCGLLSPLDGCLALLD